MPILFPGMETRSWFFLDLTLAAPKLASPAAEANLRRHETIWRGPTLLAQPGPIGTSGRIEDNDIVPCGCLLPFAAYFPLRAPPSTTFPPPRLSSPPPHPLPPP